MAFVLTRIDYLTVGTLSRQTTKIFELKPNKTVQKFAIGDEDGTLYICGFHKNNLQILHKSLPGTKIKVMVLDEFARKTLFIAKDNVVIGYSDKGKIFLEFNLVNFLGSVDAMYVLGQYLAVSSDSNYCCYLDCKEFDKFSVEEKILDIILVRHEKFAIIHVLFCADYTIRLQAHSNNLFKKILLPCHSSAAIVHRRHNLDLENVVFVGLANGKVGVLYVNHCADAEYKWLLNCLGAEITTIYAFQLDYVMHLLIGRLDGSIEIHALSEDNTFLILKYIYYAGESISSVGAGNISTNSTEILATTFSGKAFGLLFSVKESEQKKTAFDGVLRLKKEVQELEYEKDKEKNSVSGFKHFTALNELPVKHWLRFDADEFIYEFCLELDRAIDNVMLRTHAQLDLINDEKNNSVLSVSEENSDNTVTATFRCQTNVNKLEIHFRLKENFCEKIHFYITNQVQPKLCRKITIQIPLLIGLKRLPEFDEKEKSTRFFNKMEVSGKFTLIEIHSWINSILPDVPEKPLLKENEKSAQLIYFSDEANTYLQLEYEKEKLTCRSENISILRTLQNSLLKLAAKSKFQFLFDVNINSIKDVMSRIFLKYKNVQRSRNIFRIKEGLKLLNMDNPSSMSTSVKNIFALKSSGDHSESKNLQTLKMQLSNMLNDYQSMSHLNRMSSDLTRIDLDSLLKSRNFSNIEQKLMGIE